MFSMNKIGLIKMRFYGEQFNGLFCLLVPLLLTAWSTCYITIAIGVIQTIVVAVLPMHMYFFHEMSDFDPYTLCNIITKVP